MNGSKARFKTLLLNSVGLAVTVAIATPVTANDAPAPGKAHPVPSCSQSATTSQLPCSTPELISATPLEQIENYAKGQVQSGQATLNLIDYYINEGSKDQAIAEWKKRVATSDSLLNRIDRYTYEGIEEQALDLDSNRTVTFTQLDETSTLNWTFENNNSEPDQATTNVGQVTSVSQLRDVRPTDWAFTALQALVERYGVIAGYPDGTFKGNRALTRYEFAAGLNAALNRVNELVAAGSADLISKEDFANLQKLQEEFASELATIKTRVDGLETRVGRLETDRFSFTSKLFGLAFFNYTGLFGAEGALRETGFRQLPAGTGIASPPLLERVRENPNISSSGLVWLNLGSSFTGRDLLITQLATGRGISPANVVTSPTSTVNPTGIPFTDAGAFLGPGSSVVLRELVYEFPVFGNGRLAVGPRINWFRFFDINPFTFFSTGTASLNAIANTLTTETRRGAGAILQLPVTPQFDFRVGYLAEANEYFTQDLRIFNSASSPLEGLFSGTNSLTAEVTYKPAPNFNLRFLYSRANLQGRQEFLNNQIPVFSPVKLVGGPPISNGLADDGFGGSLEDASADVFGFNLDWLIARRFGVFARYGFANTHLDAEIESRSGNIKTQTFQIGFAALDLFRRGAQGTLSFLMPFDYTSGRRYLVSGGGDGGTQYELEGTYFFPVTPNLAIVPNFQVIFNLNNFSTNPTIGIFNLRTQFSF